MDKGRNSTSSISSGDDPFSNPDTGGDVSCCECSRLITEHVPSGNQPKKLIDCVYYICPLCVQKYTTQKKYKTYIILEQIGQGGMSVVYKAWHQSSWRLVALKKVFPEILDREGAIDFFLHEISIVENLIHPHIVRLIEYEVTNKEVYFTYEYMPQGDLFTFTRKNSLSTKILCKIFCQVLAGLEYAHGKGITHRDIKPHNILLKNNQAKLSDFSLARVIKDSELASRKDIGKTLLFQAPEELNDPECANPLADVYAVGVSFYYILTNMFPFSIPNQEKIIKDFLKEHNFSDPLSAIIKHKRELDRRFFKYVKQSILKEDRIPIKKYRNDLSDALAHIVDKSVKKKEENRFKSAKDMRINLEKFI